jgi:hypothetical protein
MWNNVDMNIGEVQTKNMKLMEERMLDELYPSVSG